MKIVFLIRIVFVSCCITLTISCEEPLRPAFEDQLVVNGYLYAGRGIDSILVSHTLPMNEKYTYQKSAVSDARVVISNRQKNYTLSEYSSRPGAYYLPKDSLRISSGESYSLSLSARGMHLTASTSVPDPVKINSTSTDTLSFLNRHRYRIQWNKIENAKGYLISAIATPLPKPPYSDRLVDFNIPDFINISQNLDTLEIFPAGVHFGLDKEENTFEFPWFMFLWYGDYTIKLYALDKTGYELATSGSMYAGQSSAFNEPQSNVVGGKGIFSAVSVDTTLFHVTK